MAVTGYLRREFSLWYAAHRSFLTGVASHYRWLRKLGQPESALAPA